MLRVVKEKGFANGRVYALATDDGFLVETTDTFLPFYTKNAIGRHQNALSSKEMGSRAERWLVGVSVASGCPVRCKFCATGQMKKYRPLTADEIVQQVLLVVGNNGINPLSSREFKINYTRMGDTFLCLKEVKDAISRIDRMADGVWLQADNDLAPGAKIPQVHHYISTIGIRGSDFSWIKDNITLQISLHSLDNGRRDELIPFARKMTLEELGSIRTASSLKTTVNMTLVDEADFELERLKKLFPPEHFFIKLSPINPNCISEGNHLGRGIIEARNLA